MPANSRLRLLSVLEILRKETNEQHMLTANEIISKLNSRYDIKADRRVIYEDVEALISFGYDISKYEENGRGYFLRESEFEFSELRLIADAVLSARFISKSHSRKLLDKIKSLTNKYDESRLEKVNFLNNRIKCDNAAVFYTIDLLSEAIEKSMQVSFLYMDYDIQKDLVQRDKKRRIVSPYGIVWVNDYYYLVARYSWLDTLTHFRIDKIKDIKVTDKAAHPITEIDQFKYGFDIAKYINKRVYMFGGEEERIELKCRNAILHDIIERFGEDVKISSAEEGYFIARVKAVKEGLIYFVLQFGKNIEVLNPIDFREQVTETIKTMGEKY